LDGWFPDLSLLCYSQNSLIHSNNDLDLGILDFQKMKRRW